MKKAVKAKIAEVGAMKFLKKSVPDSTLLIIAQSLGISDQQLDRKELVDCIFKQLTMNGLEKYTNKLSKANNKDAKEKSALHDSENHKTKENGGHESLSTSAKVKKDLVADSEHANKKRKSSGRKDSTSSSSKKQAERSPDKPRPVDSLSDQEDDDCEDVKMKHKDTKPIDMHAPSAKTQIKSPRDPAKKKVKENNNNSPPTVPGSPQKKPKDRDC